MDSLSTYDLPKVNFKPRRLGHVNLYVSDLGVSTEFYTNIAGVELVRREPTIEAIFFSNGNTHHDVALMQCRGGAVRKGRDDYVQASSFRGEMPGLNHLAWEMHSETVLIEKLKAGTANGLEIKFSADHLISHSAYIEDPEGIYHEFYADVTEDWRSIFNTDREDLVTADWDWQNIEAPLGPRRPDREDKRRVESALFHARCVSRAVIAVENLGHSDAFLTTVAGLTQIEQADGVAAYCAAVSAYDLLIVSAETVARPGLVGFSLLVEDENDLKTSILKADEKGINVASVIDAGHKISAIVYDPDGLAVEFYHPRKDDRLHHLPSHDDDPFWVFDY
ncbi:MAG: hypothetical protein CMP14_04160 [Rickettsiales bacterium]|nr:hypothetical protein [Rickettsiales bacterium]|tara:strand:+ start:398 stop:1405 length:1008 start_codon:yes stop_codon:yes gene_type:complete